MYFNNKTNSFRRSIENIENTENFVEVDDTVCQAMFDEVNNSTTPKAIFADEQGYPEVREFEVDKETKIGNRISELKSLLARTDYQAIKCAEGEMAVDEYEPIKAQRREWRAEINALESELEKLKS